MTQNADLNAFNTIKSQYRALARAQLFMEKDANFEFSFNSMLKVDLDPNNKGHYGSLFKNGFNSAALQNGDLKAATARIQEVVPRKYKVAVNDAAGKLAELSILQHKTGLTEDDRSIYRLRVAEYADARKKINVIPDLPLHPIEKQTFRTLLERAEKAHIWAALNQENLILDADKCDVSQVPPEAQIFHSKNLETYKTAYKEHADFMGRVPSQIEDFDGKPNKVLTLTKLQADHDPVPAIPALVENTEINPEILSGHEIQEPHLTPEITVVRENEDQKAGDIAHHIQDHHVDKKQGAEKTSVKEKTKMHAEKRKTVDSHVNDHVTKETQKPSKTGGGAGAVISNILERIKDFHAKTTGKLAIYGGATAILASMGIWAFKKKHEDHQKKQAAETQAITTSSIAH